MSGLHVAVHHFVEGAVPAAADEEGVPKFGCVPRKLSGMPAGIGELNGDAGAPVGRKFPRCGTAWPWISFSRHRG